MEHLSKNIENQGIESVDSSVFDEEKYNQLADEIQEAKDEDKKQREYELKVKMFEIGDKKEKVEEFIRDNCSEPIIGINKIVPFDELVGLLLKSAEKENLLDVKKSIEQGNAKDQRIYQLPAYKKLIQDGFILPSDVRTYYDSANREPVYHLGVDYNVKAGTEVKSIYEGKVVSSGLDGGLGHKVIIEHSMSDGTKFYSLYGHLGSKNLPKLGDEIKKGDIIGEVGEPFTKDNGDWEEHLHFQIMESKDSPKGYSKVPGELNYDVLKSFGK